MIVDGIICPAPVDVTTIGHPSWQTAHETINIDWKHKSCSYRRIEEFGWRVDATYSDNIVKTGKKK